MLFANVHPWVLFQLHHGHALCWVRSEEPSNQVLRLGRHVKRNTILARENLATGILESTAAEGKTARQQGVQDDAQGPHVQFRPYVFPALRI